MLNEELPQGNQESEKIVDNKQANGAHKFQKGVTSNPKGKPAGTRSLSTILRIESEKMAMTTKGNLIEYKEIMAKKLIQMASEGNLKAMEMVFDRLEGKPNQKIELKNDGQGTVPIGDDEQKRIEDLFSFKKEKLKKEDKEELSKIPIAIAPLPKVVTENKLVVPAGKLINAKVGKQVTNIISEQTIVFKQNGKIKLNNS